MFKHKQIILAGVLLLIVCISAGCNFSKVQNTEDAKAELLSYLEKKYDKQFEIISLEPQIDGTAFSPTFYGGEAREKGKDEVFDVVLAFEKYYGSTYETKDNYQKILYGDRIQSDVQEILTSDMFEFSNIQIRYPERNRLFEDYEDFKQNGGIEIKFDMSTEVNDYSVTVSEAYSVLEKLRDSGFYFGLSLTIGDLEHSFHYSEGSSYGMPTEAEILEKFMRDYESTGVENGMYE